MAAKFFTGLPLDGPDPECVQGYGEELLAARDDDASHPRPGQDHSHRTIRYSKSGKVPVRLGTRPIDPAAALDIKPNLARISNGGMPVNDLQDDPLADFAPSRV